MNFVDLVLDVYIIRMPNCLYALS